MPPGNRLLTDSPATSPFVRLTKRFMVCSVAALICAACGTTDPSAESTFTISEPDSSEANPAASQTPQVESSAVIDTTPPSETSSVVSQAHCTSDPSTAQTRLLQLLNEARSQSRSCGTDFFEPAGALTWNSRLEDAARAHSQDMASNNFFSHTGSNGSAIGARVSAADYTWRTVGENIAAGLEFAEEAVNGWIESPGHCRNIMNPDFSEVAISCVNDESSDFGWYWTNVLGTQR